LARDAATTNLEPRKWARCSQWYRSEPTDPG